MSKLQRRPTKQPKPRYGAGDTITNGDTYYTIQYASRGQYKMADVDVWMPVKLVDVFWRLVDDNDVEVED